VSYTYFSNGVSCQKFYFTVAFWFIADAFSMLEKKNPDAPKVSVSTARLNFNTPYRVIGDLSGPRRRVNQTENDRQLSSSYKFHRFDLSAVDHAYPHVKTSRVFYYLLPRKTPFDSSPSFLPWPFHARKRNLENT